MRSARKSPAPSAIVAFSLILVLLVLLSSSLITAQQPDQNDLFLPLTPGTWWLYPGTVTWSDQQTEKEAHANVTLKMTVEKVIQKPEFTIAILSGFPRDLDWATGEVAAMPWLFIGGPIQIAGEAGE